jgi:hypothetical protein
MKPFSVFILIGESELVFILIGESELKPLPCNGNHFVIFCSKVNKKKKATQSMAYILAVNPKKLNVNFDLDL